MSQTAEKEPGARFVDRAQYGLAAFLAVAGAYVVYDATTLSAGFSDQALSPAVLPYVVGSALIVLAIALAIATARGDAPEAEAGEDVDLTSGADWTTVSKLVAVFVVNIVLIDVLSWAITGALLFAGCTWVLGSRTPVRDLAIGAVMSVGTWYGFYVGLGIPIPAGILDGIL
ncbi:tripartite tricarboxylate transporter TctB family protein [Mumia zhuanghuii]|uniref:Tripartite tricarboxylate transporter TctB family protein n=1 Tax=Mumia zhuanghuii TaxID=2585211 RepID=A0A5C4MAF5_9ACTN|nr:tripartite tricarboxylate transporter TctB family protein [Mumia zhuanghuii]TNC30640.1 tripartite tricarboxylate transporter TctB family protein [Mumia zhuanghuii]TNC47952.1 tripartite tricarboxylate transporter TctB family protein [Mumia zhuanghuii]